MHGDWSGLYLRDVEITKIPFVIARPQAVAIHRPQSAAPNCRATLATTEVNDCSFNNFLFSLCLNMAALSYTLARKFGG